LLSAKPVIRLLRNSECCQALRDAFPADMRHRGAGRILIGRGGRHSSSMLAEQHREMAEPGTAKQ
jgi:hypothetical protein